MVSCLGYFADMLIINSFCSMKLSVFTTQDSIHFLWEKYKIIYEYLVLPISLAKETKKSQKQWNRSFQFTNQCTFYSGRLVPLTKAIDGGCHMWPAPNDTHHKYTGWPWEVCLDVLFGQRLVPPLSRVPHSTGSTERLLHQQFHLLSALNGVLKGTLCWSKARAQGLKNQRI